jgi:hypothetical protein
MTLKVVYRVDWTGRKRCEGSPVWEVSLISKVVGPGLNLCVVDGVDEL